MGDDMKVLMDAIEIMVQERLAVSESELMDEFVFTEDMREVANVKAACIKLEDAGRLSLQTDKNGGMIVSCVNNTFH
jgi:hypothetical protein